MSFKKFDQWRLVAVLAVFVLCVGGFCCGARAAEAVKIFPIPQEAESTGRQLKLDEETVIVVPEYASEQDMLLARTLVADLSDRYGLAAKIERESEVPENGKIVLMGSVTNPLIKKYCAENDVEVSAAKPGAEGYVLQVGGRVVLIAGSDDRGAFYGLQSLRQLIEKKDGEVYVEGANIRDWPYKKFRGIRIFAPGHENIAFFKRFVRDFMALYKFNTVVIEFNATMRLDRHPELNAGSIDFWKDMSYRRRNYPYGVGNREVNSTHYDTADGDILEKDDVEAMVRYAKKYHIEVVPEIPSLTHSYYLLTRHKELADVPQEEWPDSYCPSNPKTYELLFDVFDEYLEVIKPKMVHIAHDEWFMPIGYCELCKGKKQTELYASDVNKIHNYLKSKGIKLAMWGDHLLEAVRGKQFRERTTEEGYSYKAPGGLSEAEARALIPKDILIFNWFWSTERSPKREENEDKLAEMGFKQLFGNFRPHIKNWGRRSAKETFQGGSPSSWAPTSEFCMGKDLMYNFLGCANLLWSTHWPEQEEVLETVQEMMPEIRRNLSGRTEPSADGDPVSAIDISSYVNGPADGKVLGEDISSLAAGKVGVDRKTFSIPGGGKNVVLVGVEGEEPNPLPREVNGIKIGRDVSSLIFLHACAKEARRENSYCLVWPMGLADDTVDLLGWYEVVYEDNYVMTIPLRYSINILEMKKGSGNYCYGADAVKCSKAGEDEELTFFAFEWKNPRFGKKIKEVNLKGTEGFYGPKLWHGDFNQPVKTNAVILAGLSVVEKREVEMEPLIKW